MVLLLLEMRCGGFTSLSPTVKNRGIRSPGTSGKVKQPFGRQRAGSRGGSRLFVAAEASAADAWTKNTELNDEDFDTDEDDDTKSSDAGA